MSWRSAPAATSSPFRPILSPRVNAAADPASAPASEAETTATIRDIWNTTGELVDPHTAVGLAAAARLPRGGAPVVTLSTASPAKFPEAVPEGVPATAALHPRAEALLALPERMTKIAADADAVKTFVREFARS